MTSISAFQINAYYDAYYYVISLLHECNRTEQLVTNLCVCAHKDHRLTQARLQLGDIMGCFQRLSYPS